MKPYLLKLEIVARDDNFYYLRILGPGKECQIMLHVRTNELHYIDTNALSGFIKENEYQLIKILTSKKHSGLHPGTITDFVIIEGFKFIKNEDYFRHIIVDQRNNIFYTQVRDTVEEGIPHIYSDGSYLRKFNGAGFAGIIKNKDGTYKTYHQRSRYLSSNLMELLGVITGLKKLKKEEKIQINTDSRFVIKGLTQWIHYWKHNNWCTATGEKAKFKRYWEIAHNLTVNKFIVYKWIKAHSNHFEQSYCDILAKEMATSTI